MDCEYVEVGGILRLEQDVHLYLESCACRRSLKRKRRDGERNGAEKDARRETVVSQRSAKLRARACCIAFGTRIAHAFNYTLD